MNEPKTEAIMPIATGTGVVMADEGAEIVSISEQRIEAFDRLMTLALKKTTYRDWMSLDDQPYLSEPGATRIARRFGIKVWDVKTEKEWSKDSRGEFYLYKTTGKIALPAGYGSIEALGACSQRDKFFAYQNGQWKESVDVDEGNIMKASYSNFFVNGVTHLLGLRKMTWEELKAAGIDTERIQKVSYEKGADKVKATLPPELQKKQRDIWAICLQLGAGDVAEAKTFLKQASKFKGKDKDGNPQDVFVDDVRRLTTERWLNMTLSNVTAAFKKAYPNEDVPSAGEQENLL